MPIRLECYGRIKNAMKQRIVEYYRAHPERLGDERSQRAIKESMDGLEIILNILDEYDIKRRTIKNI